MTANDTPNYKWIYTYDYAPASLWEPWRDAAYASGGLDARGTPEWITEEAAAVAGRVRPGLLSFLLLTDSHFVINGTWEDTVSAMKALAGRIGPKGIIHLGDLTDGLLPLEKTRELERQVVTDLENICRPVYLVPGNHDYNYFRGNKEIRYPERPQFFADYPEEQLRLIFIDSFDPKESARYGFTDYCVHWLESVLAMLPEGYSVIVFSHVTPLVRLQAWTDNIRNREKLMGVLDRYAGRILALVTGHSHCDHLYNELYNGRFPIVSVNCAKCEYFTEHKPEGAVVPERALGDRTQESFDVLQVDGAKRELFFIRYGAGKDRAVRDGKAIWLT